MNLRRLCRQVRKALNLPSLIKTESYDFDLFWKSICPFHTFTFALEINLVNLAKLTLFGFHNEPCFWRGLPLRAIWDGFVRVGIRHRALISEQIKEWGCCLPGLHLPCSCNTEHDAWYAWMVCLEWECECELWAADLPGVVILAMWRLLWNRTSALKSSLAPVSYQISHVNSFQQMFSVSHIK